ncbi:MAG: SDR family oxidoreductase [Pseudonocardiaceae bacterium]
MTRALALELAPDGIWVNAICPGTVETPMVAGPLEADTAAGQPRDHKHQLGRISTARGAGGRTCLPRGTDASFVTGVSPSVDGGQAIR